MFKIDGPFYAQLGNAAEEAKRLADIGYDGVYSLEGNADPFLPLLLASEHAPSLDISTGIAVAFPRNPAHLAYQAWDLHKFSKGKFTLGLGSQIKAHIEKRFGCEFDQPVARMREHIEATKAFFDCWQNGTRLNYEGQFCRHTLMTPMFDAQPNPYGVPPIYLGALGPKMTEVAGAVADGWIVHPFNNLQFLRNEGLPALQKGLKTNPNASDFCISINVIVVTGETEEAMNLAKESVRGLLGFYGSTPAYKPPMTALGYGELQPELNIMSKEGRWDELATLVDDSFVDAFAIVAEPKDVAQQLHERYGDIADRVSIYAPYAAPDEMWANIIRDIKSQH